jgi:hypothetical protein
MKQQINGPEGSKVIRQGDQECKTHCFWKESFGSVYAVQIA